MKKAVVIVPTERAHRETFEANAPDLEFIYEYSAEALKEASVVIGNPPKDDLIYAEKLEWIQLSMAGTEPYSLPGVLPDSVALTNSTGAFGLAISECMVGYVFELFKKLHLYRDNQLKSEWLDRGSVKRVEGSRVLILGMGDIGSEFGKKMKALGCHITGVKRTLTAKPDWCDELFTSDAIDSLIPSADIIALALPNTSETVNILSRERIAMMKNDAIIINVGRGNAIDPDALYEAVSQNKLGGAALDVTMVEPLPKQSPLWNCENIVITPHITGFFHLRDTYDMIIEIAAENLRRYSGGEKLLNRVDKSTRYRANGDEGFSREKHHKS